MDDSQPSLEATTLDVDTIRQGIVGLRLGRRLIYLPAVGSTNTYAMELARGGASEGVVITTDDQTAGRGRIGRAWKSLPGEQLILSLLLRPSFPPHFLVMASALAVAGAVEEVTGLRADIKWPNDVLLRQRKICGILIETSDGFAVLGMGLNVNGSLADDADLGLRASTLADEAGHSVSREAVAIALLRRLDSAYTALQDGGVDARQTLRDEWRARLVTLGPRVVIRQQAAEVTGIADDVDADGGLILRRDNGVRELITWGDIE